MKYDPDDARTIILAICCLHNMLRSDSVGRTMYTPSVAGFLNVLSTIVTIVNRFYR